MLFVGRLRITESKTAHPQFCPKCGALVPGGVERCPVCGARIQPRVMDRRTGFTWADFRDYSLVAILFALAAFLIPILLGGLCYGLYLLLGEAGG